MPPNERHRRSMYTVKFIGKRERRRVGRVFINVPYYVVVVHLYSECFGSSYFPFVWCVFG